MITLNEQWMWKAKNKNFPEIQQRHFYGNAMFKVSFGADQFGHYNGGGIERSEIEACRETNRVLLEGKANSYPGVMNTTVRESASGARLPDSAINPTPRTK